MNCGEFLTAEHCFIHRKHQQNVLCRHPQTFIKQIVHFGRKRGRHRLAGGHSGAQGGVRLFDSSLHTDLLFRKTRPWPRKSQLLTIKCRGFSSHFSLFLNYFSFLNNFACVSSVFLVYLAFALEILLPANLKTTAEMDNISIKDNIRKVRQRRRLTQEEMAHRLNISITAYRDLEKGKTSILNNYVGQIADVFDTSAEELVLGYKPIQMGIQDVKEVREEYQGKVFNLERRIQDLEKVIRLLEENIQSKDQIISMLKK